MAPYPFQLSIEPISMLLRSKNRASQPVLYCILKFLCQRESFWSRDNAIPICIQTDGQPSAGDPESMHKKLNCYKSAADLSRHGPFLPRLLKWRLLCLRFRCKGSPPSARRISIIQGRQRVSTTQNHAHQSEKSDPSIFRVGKIRLNCPPVRGS
jgi:hypothetical protein